MTHPGDTPKEDPRQFDTGRDAWLREQATKEQPKG